MAKQRPQNLALLLAIKLYQLFLSPFLGGSCRYYPSCSQYASECFERMTFRSALGHTCRRLLKCHPFGGHGFDPAPSGSGEVN